MPDERIEAGGNDPSEFRDIGKAVGAFGVFLAIVAFRLWNLKC